MRLRAYLLIAIIASALVLFSSGCISNVHLPIGAIPTPPSQAWYGDAVLTTIRVKNTGFWDASEVTVKIRVTAGEDEIFSKEQTFATIPVNKYVDVMIYFNLEKGSKPLMTYFEKATIDASASAKNFVGNNTWTHTIQIKKPNADINYQIPDEDWIAGNFQLTAGIHRFEKLEARYTGTEHKRFDIAFGIRLDSKQSNYMRMTNFTTQYSLDKKILWILDMGFVSYENPLSRADIGRTRFELSTGGLAKATIDSLEILVLWEYKPGNFVVIASSNSLIVDILA